MARQSDADLIRAITGGISEIGQLFKPTNAELQSQRITSQETQAALNREYETARIDSQRDYEENQFAHKLVLQEIDETINTYKQRTEAQELKGIALENAGPSNKYTKGYIELLNQGFKNDESSKLELVNFLDEVSQANDALYANEARFAAIDRGTEAMFAGADADKNFAMSDDEFEAFAKASSFDEQELQYIKDNFTKNAPGYAEAAAEKIKADAIIKYGDETAGLEIRKMKTDIAKTLEDTKGQELENAKTRLEINALIDVATDANNGIMPETMRGQFGFTNKEGYRLPKTGDKNIDEMTEEWNSIAYATLETGSAKANGDRFSQNAVNFVHGVMTNKKLGKNNKFTKDDARSFLEDSINPVQWLTSSKLTDRQKEQLISLAQTYYQPMQGVSQAERDRVANLFNKDNKDNGGDAEAGNETASSYKSGMNRYNKIKSRYDNASDDVKALIDADPAYNELKEKYGDAEASSAKLKELESKKATDAEGIAKMIMAGDDEGLALLKEHEAFLEKYKNQENKPKKAFNKILSEVNEYLSGEYKAPGFDSKQPIVDSNKAARNKKKQSGILAKRKEVEEWRKANRDESGGKSDVEVYSLIKKNLIDTGKMKTPVEKDAELNATAKKNFVKLVKSGKVRLPNRDDKTRMKTDADIEKAFNKLIFENKLFTPKQKTMNARSEIVVKLRQLEKDGKIEFNSDAARDLFVKEVMWLKRIMDGTLK